MPVLLVDPVALSEPEAVLVLAGVELVLVLP
jgi:hypothetical protein